MTSFEPGRLCRLTLKNRATGDNFSRAPQPFCHASNQFCFPGVPGVLASIAGQARVDALDGRIGPVGVNFNDEFEPIIGHARSSVRGRAPRVPLPKSRALGTHPPGSRQVRLGCPTSAQPGDRAHAAATDLLPKTAPHRVCPAGSGRSGRHRRRRPGKGRGRRVHRAGVPSESRTAGRVARATPHWSVWVARLLKSAVESVDRGFDGHGLVNDRYMVGVPF